MTPLSFVLMSKSDIASSFIRAERSTLEFGTIIVLPSRLVGKLWTSRARVTCRENFARASRPNFVEASKRLLARRCVEMFVAEIEVV